ARAANVGTANSPSFATEENVTSGAGRRPEELAGLDQLDPVLIGIADETEPVAALAHGVRRTLGLDPLLGETHENPVEVVDADRDVPVAGPEVVRAAVVVEGQLQLGLVAREREEVVRRFELALADDVQVALELHPERLVERAAPVRVGDAN